MCGCTYELLQSGSNRTIAHKGHVFMLMLLVDNIIHAYPAGMVSTLLRYFPMC